MFQIKWRRSSQARSQTNGRKASPRLQSFFKPRCEALEERTLLSFSQLFPYGVGANPTAEVLGDFNGDNKPDIAVTNSGATTISVLLNSGNGTFGSATPYTVGSHPNSIAVGDFNGDNKLDLAV